MFRVRAAALGRLGARFSTRRLAVTPLRSLRGLCTGKADGGGSGESTEEPSEPPCDPMQEPSEATADPEALTLRAKEILATKNEAARYSQNQKRAAGVGCAALGAGGAGVLVYHHLDYLMPYMLDFAGLSLLGASAVIALEVFGSKKKDAEEVRKGGWQLKLVPLHDEARFASAAAQLSPAAPTAKDKGGSGLDEALAAAEKEHKEKQEQAKADRGKAPRLCRWPVASPTPPPHQPDGSAGSGRPTRAGAPP